MDGSKYYAVDGFSKTYYTQRDGTFFFGVQRKGSPRFRSTVVAEFDPAVWEFLIENYDREPVAVFGDHKPAEDVQVGQYL